MATESNTKTGRIVQILGSVIDLAFDDELPEIYNAVEIEALTSQKEKKEKIVAEVQQHLGGENGPGCGL